MKRGCAEILYVVSFCGEEDEENEKDKRRKREPVRGQGENCRKRVTRLTFRDFPGRV